MSGVMPQAAPLKFIAGPTENRACKPKMKTCEYIEGPEAKEKFDQAMRTAFQASKPTPRKPKQKPEVSTIRKTKRPDKD
jgi:hypothetical protein